MQILYLALLLMQLLYYLQDQRMDGKNEKTLKVKL